MYERFALISGTHPWRDVSPEGYIDYLVQYRSTGRVMYFNFSLAREIGLIPPNHPSSMNSKLERKILRTFSLQIINEYDHINRPEVIKKSIKNRTYMATRYLQLQHENKQGKTSGDGRSIWNGYLEYEGKLFDISSCGTGATILSPGAQEADQPIKTGDETFGFSCGRADLDEMLASAVMSEIFYQEGIPTERVLTVIDYPDKSAVGVRTAPNLIRPAHFFRYLKSNQLDELKLTFDYFIKRQIHNKEFSVSNGKNKYQECLSYFSRKYAKLAAVLEEEYIFNWLAWDGDNMLATGALLDYGSIRQFAAKHNKYRYEDVDRFSTSLSEQRYWAKRTVQTFAQAIDYVLKGEKDTLESFQEHESLKYFDACFEEEKNKQMLSGLGFDEEQIKNLIKNHNDKINNFKNELNYFEDLKVSEGEKKTPDGIDHPPIFLIRHILRELPLYIYNELKVKSEWPFMDPKNFCRLMAASYAKRKDLRINLNRKQRSIKFQQTYKNLVFAIDEDYKKTIRGLAKRSSIINYKYRRTGDGLTWIIEEAIRHTKRMSRSKLQEAIERFISSQVLVPGKWKPIKEDELKGRSLKSKLLKKIQKKLEVYHELI